METEDWEVISYSDSMIQADEKEIANEYATQQKGELFNSIKVSLKSMGTNIMYNIEELGSCSLAELLNNSIEPLYLYGTELPGTDPMVYKKLNACMDGTLWFSYRKKFPYALSTKNIIYTTDASKIIRLGVHNTGSPDVPLPNAILPPKDSI